jgi:hypothetical protein
MIPLWVAILLVWLVVPLLFVAALVASLSFQEWRWRRRQQRRIGWYS